MLESWTDTDWEWFGENDPYYGVITGDQFSRTNLTEDSRRIFFQRGESYIQNLSDVLRTRLNTEFHPQRVLDFGCGVGRIAIPLAKRYPEVVGVDVSPSMLEHARANCREKEIENVKFIETRDLDSVSGQFDFVHSFIVFQHIPVSKGEAITRRLLDLISPNGVGVLHYTYHPGRKMSPRSRLLLGAYRHIPYAYALRRLLKKRPVMQMNRYDINKLLFLIQEAGCTDVHMEFTDHGYRGVIIMFQKKQLKGLEESRGQSGGR